MAFFLDPCKHPAVEDSRSGAGKLIAFVCKACLSVLCPACKGNAHPPDDVPPELRRARGYCACRLASHA